MIPQDTLTIIEREAQVLNIFHAISPAHEYWRRGFIAGAKRGYELAMDWTNIDEEEPPKNVRLLCLSPIYPEGHEMRYRILDSQFVRISREVKYYMTLPSPPTP